MTTNERLFGTSRISPDGTRLAVSLEEEILSIWGLDLARDSMTRISFGSDDHNVAWSPDGTQVAFESGRGGVHQVFIRAANGSGEAEAITSGDFDHYLCDWSRDGRTIAFVEYHPDTGSDLWTVELDSGEARPFVNTRFYEKEAAFSPDGRWVAYASDETGIYEVYVRARKGGGTKWLVSSGGGEEPAWSSDGSELYFRSGGRMMAVQVDAGRVFSTSAPEVLFEGLFHFANFPTRTYDVTTDGRFVMTAEPGEESATTELNVLVNWAEGVPAETT